MAMFFDFYSGSYSAHRACKADFVDGSLSRSMFEPDSCRSRRRAPLAAIQGLNTRLVEEVAANDREITELRAGIALLREELNSFRAATSASP